MFGYSADTKKKQISDANKENASDSKNKAAAAKKKTTTTIKTKVADALTK